jgi:hypothetical protein
LVRTRTGEGAARLERARVLELLELQRERRTSPSSKSVPRTSIIGVTRTCGAMPRAVGRDLRAVDGGVHEDPCAS